MLHSGVAGNNVRGHTIGLRSCLKCDCTNPFQGMAAYGALSYKALLLSTYDHSCTSHKHRRLLLSVARNINIGYYNKDSDRHTKCSSNPTVQVLVCTCLFLNIT